VFAFPTSDPSLNASAQQVHLSAYLDYSEVEQTSPHWILRGRVSRGRDWKDANHYEFYQANDTYGGIGAWLREIP
jgi:hypothetical protein